MLPIFYGLISALTWGAGDFAGGLAARKTGAYRAVLWAEAIGLVVLLGALFFVDEAFPDGHVILLSTIAGMLGSLGLLAFYHAMSVGQMSTAAPVSALLAAALPVVVGSILDGWPKLTTLIGFGLAFAAIWLISQDEQAVLPPVIGMNGLKIALVAGIGFGFYFVLMNRASADNHVLWPMIFARSSGMLLVLGFLLIRRENFTVVRSAWPFLLINGVFDVGGNLFYILSGQHGRLDVSAVLGALYPGMTVFLAWVFLKERIARIQALGIALALGAIVLFTL